MQVSPKGPGDFVSLADNRSEKVLYEELSKGRPGYGFVMEESGIVEGSDKTHVWHIDPLDGTTNFLHGIPMFAISIALEREGQIVAGLVYNPADDAMYVTEKGQGAWGNNRRLRVAGAARNVAIADRLRRAASRQVARASPLQGRARRGDDGASSTCAAPAASRSTSPMSPPAGSTASGSAGSTPGTSPPASC